jgi:hypothetical protein
MLQIVALPVSIILTTLGVSFMLLDNINSTGVTLATVIYDCHIFFVRKTTTSDAPSCGITFDGYSADSDGDLCS